MNLYYVVIVMIAILILFPTISRYIKDNYMKKSKKEKYEPFKLSKSGDYKIVFSAYTADWCPHCVDFKENVYGQLQRAFNNHPNIKVRNVDCTNDKNGSIKTEAGKQIEGYPTLMINIYENGKMREMPYEGPRMAEDIISYLRGL